MSQVFSAEKVERKSSDFVLLCTLFLLLSVGLVALFSSSYFRSERLYNNPLTFFLNQVVSAGLGIVLAFVASRIPLEKVRKFIPWLLLASFALMLLTFVPGIGAAYWGGQRWLSVFGYSFQPSELVKLSMILYLASVIEKKYDRLDRPLQGLFPPLLIVVLFVLLIFFQNNFSTAAFVLVVSLGVFFAAGVKLRWFAIAGLLTVPLVVLSILSREHRIARIFTFLNPDEDPQGSGYQVLASLSALHLGGFGGVGIGQSSRKAGILPEAQSDFILAIWGEELGYIGIIAVIVLFGLLAWRGYSIAARTEGIFLRLLAFGLTTSIVLQAMINMGVVSSLLPATGIPLPFFSSGGSSLLMTLIMCGLLINVSRQSKAGVGAKNG